MRQGKAAKYWGRMNRHLNLKTYKHTRLETQNMLSLCKDYCLLDFYDYTRYK